MRSSSETPVLINHQLTTAAQIKRAHFHNDCLMCATGAMTAHREAAGALIGQLLSSDLIHNPSWTITAAAAALWV